jgi:hypothetical protein
MSLFRHPDRSWTHSRHLLPGGATGALLDGLFFDLARYIIDGKAPTNSTLPKSSFCIRPSDISISMNTKNAQAIEITENAHQSESPNGVKGWWKRKNLRALNLWMLIPLLSIFAQGYASV